MAPRSAAAMETETKETDEATVSTVSTRDGLNAAEAAARALLAAHGDAWCPSQADVLAVLRKIGTRWPTQARPNVTDTGKPVPGMCLGLVFAMGTGLAVSQMAREHRALTRMLSRFVALSVPERGFPFSSLQINFNYAAIKHVDKNNLGPSYILSLGEHEGGALWTADQGELACHGAWRLFNGTVEHATTPFTGRERISFIAFTHELYNKVSRGVEAELAELGFSAGNASGAECAYFGRCRVDKNRSRCELRADDPALFAEYQSRRQAEQPPPAGAGVVAVECHGMNLIPMAHRKGWKESAGWVSFVREPARPDAIDKIEFAQNRTGFHVVELGAARAGGGGAVALAPAPGSPRRFNFYKDLAGETRKFAAWVKALKPGALVAICISDTAAASTRPLGAEVYAALRALGAAADMPKIAYRAPFVFVGAKGLPPGGAVCGDGAGDQIKAILRVEARVELPAAGALPRLHALSRGATCVVEKLYETEGAAPVSLADGKLVIPVAGGEELTFAAAAQRDAARARAPEPHGAKAAAREAGEGDAPPPSKRRRAAASKAAETAKADAPRDDRQQTKRAVAAPLLNDLQRGTLVEARYGYGDTWYEGRVEEAHASAGASTKYTIAWTGDDEGTYTPNIPASKIRLPA